MPNLAACKFVIFDENSEARSSTVEGAEICFNRRTEHLKDVAKRSQRKGL